MIKPYTSIKYQVCPHANADQKLFHFSFEPITHSRIHIAEELQQSYY